MEPQPLITGHAERILPGGDVLVRHGRQQFLVRNAIPGDTVRCRIEGKRHGVLRGRVEALMDASDLRAGTQCGIAAVCGGCALQFLDPAHHAAIKSAWVRDAFMPFFGSDTLWNPIHKAPECGQRRRVRWWRGEDPKGAFLGFRARNTHMAVRIPACRMVCPEMDKLRLYIQEHIPDGIESVRMTYVSGGIHVVFEGSRISDASVQYPALLSGNADICAPVVPWWRGSSAAIPLLRPVKTLHDLLPTGDARIRLPVGPDDFVQGHAAGNAEMVRQVQEWAGTPRFVADLFCGVGNLSLPLAYATGAEVRGGDAAVSSIRQANICAREYGLNARYESMNLFEPFDLGPFSGADALILDPPRKGAKRICRSMGALLPATIIMVNCDVASGARDARELYRTGYRLRALRAFDLFPYAGHVEAMSLWRR